MNIVAASLAALTVLAAQQPSEIGRSIYHEATGVSVWLNRGEFKTSGGSCDLNHKVAAGAALCFPALNPEGASWSDLS